MNSGERHEFKARAIDRIVNNLPPSGRFDALVPQELREFGDEIVIATKREDGYNISVDKDYAQIHKGKGPRLLYHMYISYPEHGAELATVFMENNLPCDFEVSVRATAVKWDKEWAQPKEMVLEDTPQGLIGRTVEYALAFSFRDPRQAGQMMEIITTRFTLRKEGFSEPQSWEIPDVRVLGMKSVKGMKAVITNHYCNDKIITLAKSALPMVEYRGRVLVNKSLSEVIK